MKPRRLWASVIVVALLVGGAGALWFLGERPALGLDLEGGVSVILTAPDGTTSDVMERALENIRRRIDSFGTAEPQLLISGTSIEIQIPGLARGTVQPRSIAQSCLRDAEGMDYGCFDDATTAAAALDATAVERVVRSVCLTGGLLGAEPPCFGSAKEARSAIDGFAIAAGTASATPTPSPSAGAGPAPVTQVCVTGTGLATDPCFDSQAEAQAAIDAVGVGAPTVDFCLVQNAQALTGADGAACAPTEPEATALLEGLSVQERSQEFCVVSSAGKDLGCFATRDEAEARLQQTGQERLLEVIGTTARLEMREVIKLISPADTTYDLTPVTCGTPEEQATSDCTAAALADEQVVFVGDPSQIMVVGTDVGNAPPKYVLGPVGLTGDAISKATAVYASGGTTSTNVGWQVDFTLTGAGADAFGDLTSRLVQKDLAIIVDDQVLSAPTVQSAITGGQGTISGSFTEQEAKDLATVLNAGALPVNLVTQQVVTVSPTLGQESLQQGLRAGVGGLIALALYLLFYYRLLGIVAFAGMSVWALLAYALVTLAGSAIGYSLTLAGVAGLVISLGVTADSYIVFFERLKDEIRVGRTPRAAVQPAFKRAYRTIVAADVVTGLAAIILYVTAISSVRGFALSLGVATALDLFVVYFFKRPVVFLIARSERLVNLRGFGLTSATASAPLPGESS